ncbi:MAG: hypothetical protein KDH92_05395 [Chloroflexi bacterium]|nr:hypothetical protein [Chloroflexota bacterium]
MATFIQAVTRYAPRLHRQPTIRIEELAERLAELTGLRSSQATMVLQELSAALVHYCRRGHGLELPGIGFFRPSLRNDGRMRILFRPDQRLLRELAGLDGYRGAVSNVANIGFGPLQYKALWDAEHPDDPLELPANFVGGE